MEHAGSGRVSVEIQAGGVGSSVDICNALYSGRELLPAAFGTWNGTRGDPGGRVESPYLGPVI